MSKTLSQYADLHINRLIREKHELHAEIKRLQRELANGPPRDMQVADGMIRDLRAEIEQLKLKQEISKESCRLKILPCWMRSSG